MSVRTEAAACKDQTSGLLIYVLPASTEDRLPLHDQCLSGKWCSLPSGYRRFSHVLFDFTCYFRGNGGVTWFIIFDFAGVVPLLLALRCIASI